MKLGTRMLDVAPMNACLRRHALRLMKDCGYCNRYSIDTYDSELRL